MKTALTALVMAALLAGCATTPPPVSRTGLEGLEAALTDDAADLRARADQGEARSQMALSLVYRYGLHGHRPDPAMANAWLTRAIAQRGHTSITQYIAGLNGAPGRTHIINVPRYEVTGHDVSRAVTCAEALRRNSLNPKPGPRAFAACGDPAAFLELRVLWVAAAREN